MMNRIDAIGNQPQMTFRAKQGNRKQIHEFIDKSSDLAMEILNKDRPLTEKRENIIRKSLELLTFKRMLNIELNYLKIQTFVGLGKFLGKCDKALNKIPFIKEARNKKFAKLEQEVKSRVEKGMIDADDAGNTLIKANPNIK